jgi:hypothetical protein
VSDLESNADACSLGDGRTAAAEAACPRFEEAGDRRSDGGDLDVVAVYAGQGVALAAVRPAAEVVAGFVGAADLLRRAASGWSHTG